VPFRRSFLEIPARAAGANRKRLCLYDCEYLVSIFWKMENGTTMALQPVLRPSDIPLALRLASHPGERYEDLGAVFGNSTSSAHRAVARLEQSGLLLPGERRANREALKEFLVHGVRYAFPPVRGPEARGVPTAWSAPALQGVPPNGPMVVWPSEHGKVRGESLVPLCKSVPAAVQRDPQLYEMLALIEALRIGQARDRRMAADLLRKRLSNGSP
jgi:hypothetical protein